MVANLKAGIAEREQHLQYALGVLHDQAANLDQLKKKIAASKTTWLVAGLTGDLNRRFPAPPAPTEFTVIATDGSHIDVSRHQATRCFLINIGRIVLHYGTSPSATLESLPYLCSGSNELVVKPNGNSARQQPIEGNLLGIRRSVDECQHLAGLARGLPAEHPALALLDGSLILWGLEAYPEFVTDALLNRGFLAHLDTIREISRRQPLALASYISLPRSTDVVNALRVAVCPHEPADCDHCGQTPVKCVMMAGLQDQELFAYLLSSGERSAVFVSRSSIIPKYYREHEVHFFYLKLDEEIARVEVPGWVAGDDRLLALTHSLVLDQCQRGQGYPVALSEAHEQAVVTTADRDNFWRLVESSLVTEQLPSPSSAKSRSKMTRWV